MKPLAFIKNLWRKVMARYEGAVWRWGERSLILGTNQDARFDADAMSRKEIMRKARYFERNNAFVNRLADIFEQYTVGCGLPVVSASADATEYFKRWSQDCDALGLCSFSQMQGIAARGWFVDGEQFIVRVVVKGRLKIQLIEAHRVETPPTMASEEGKTVVDGIGIDGNGRFTGIWVKRAENGAGPAAQAAWDFVAAEDVAYVGEPNRAGMYRSLSFLYPVMNDINDLDDLQMLTMQVAKQAATIGNVTTNRTGELSTQEARRTLLKINTANSAGSSTVKNAADYYTVKLGASEIALQHGDSIKQFQADRPSLAEREHWDYLVSKICAGVGISKLLVMPYSMQGTVARADLDIAAAFFRARSAVMQAAAAKVFCWVIEWAEKFDRQVLTGGFDFTNYEDVTVRPPRAVNVDVGRNSNALIAELQNKIRTYQDEYAEQGRDWREQFRKIKEETEYAKQLGITLADVAPAVADSEPDGDESEPKPEEKPDAKTES